VSSSTSSLPVPENTELPKLHIRSRPCAGAKVLQIFREQVKPGKGAAHETVEAGWPKAFAKAKWPTH
jgi:hypothetical protein